MSRTPAVAMSLVCLVALTVLVCEGCSVATEPNALGPLPDRQSFVAGGVSTFMERRCGSLDCHGQIGRPLRIYSDTGLRLDQGPNGVRDTRATTEKEKLENYRAVIGLEPEALAESVATGGAYVDFQLLKKPLDSVDRGVKHKGGPVLRFNDRGWHCLHGWISGALNPDDCRAAAQIEPEP